MGTPMDLIFEEVKTRIEAVQYAIKRTRLAFLVGNVACASVLFAGWNAYFSWYRSFAMQPSFTGNPVTDEAQRDLLRGWVESQVINTPLLGIRIGVSDFAFLGSIALFVVAAWFFYATRKENHLIGVLLRDTHSMPADFRRLVYHGVSGYMVFRTMTLDDSPITNLAGESQQKKAIFFVRPAIKVLFYLPPLAIALLVCMDFLTVLWWPAAFRLGHGPLRGILPGAVWLQFGIMEVTACVFVVLTCVLSRRTAQFDEATRNLLIEYGNLPRDER